MKKLVILMALVLVVAACKTTRQTVKQKSETDTSIKTDIVEKNKLETTQTTTAAVVDKGTVTEAMEEVTTITVLSRPDSVTGAQFPIQVTTINKHTAKADNRNLSSVMIDTNALSYVTSKVDQSDYKSETTLKTEDKTITEEKTPAWISLGVFLVFAIIYYLGYLILERYGIIKKK